ncbi:MAG: Superoxide dismutase (Fe) [Parcubacteria group bacterium GW2011_GWA2_47_12]|nr:MAG: Superoxide dismutase (Fe) [Parcubacteria group bacterium GW2011_GWA2_47_12]
MIFTEQKFTIPVLKGISAKNIEEHLKLYAGYVKNLNLVHDIVENPDNHEYARREAYRRQAFEFDGMRNHEYYFRSFEGGPRALSSESPLYKKITAWTDTFEFFLEIFKNLATTRGIGWAMLGYDKHTDKLIQYWVDEQHLGHLTGVVPILALDMWEHAFVADYQPSGKKNYVEDFFLNLNWKIIEQNFSNAISK